MPKFRNAVGMAKLNHLRAHLLCWDASREFNSSEHSVFAFNNRGMSVRKVHIDHSVLVDVRSFATVYIQATKGTCSSRLAANNMLWLTQVCLGSIFLKFARGNLRKTESRALNS